MFVVGSYVLPSRERCWLYTTAESYMMITGVCRATRSLTRMCVSNSAVLFVILLVLCNKQGIYS